MIKYCPQGFLLSIIFFVFWLSPMNVYSQGSSMCVTGNTGDTPAIDGAIDGTYNHVTENPYAAPVAGGSTSSSDFIGESSGKYVYYDAQNFNWSSCDDIFSQGWGTADIHNFHVTWDLNNLYLVVQGPSAYGISGVDRMDMFIAIDVDNATGPTVSLASTSAPFNKRVDFAGWAPDYFVSVENWGYAELRAAGGATAIQTNNSGGAGSFQYVISGDITEIQIDWDDLGGKPNDFTGATWNIAIYTVYDDDQFDSYDTAPGMGQNPAGGGFEELGDMPWDSDYCSGATDPVTGSGDGTCGWGESDDHEGNGADSGGYGDCRDGGAGSDNAQSNGGGTGDFDTIEEYYQITNIGQIDAQPSISSVPCITIDCAEAIPDYSGTINTRNDISTSDYVTNLGSITYTDGGDCYFPLTISRSTPVESGTSITCDAGTVLDMVTVTYTVTDAIGNSASVDQTYCREDLTPLPVLLSGFRAEKNKDGVFVSWLTYSEFNSERFDLMYSEDQRNWNKIYTTFTGSNSEQTKYYSYLHRNPLKENYYQLVQFDNDGKTEKSETIFVRLDNLTLTVFPNPFVDEIRVDGVVDFEYELIGARGRSLVREKTSGSISTVNVPSGIYILKIFDADGSLINTQKVAKY